MQTFKSFSWSGKYHSFSVNPLFPLYPAWIMSYYLSLTQMGVWLVSSPMDGKGCVVTLNGCIFASGQGRSSWASGTVVQIQPSHPVSGVKVNFFRNLEAFKNVMFVFNSTYFQIIFLMTFKNSFSSTNFLLLEPNKSPLVPICWKLLFHILLLLLILIDFLLFIEAVWSNVETNELNTWKWTGIKELF